MMKETLRPGITKTRRVRSHRKETSITGDELAICSDEWIVHEIEHTCLDLILEHADPGENSVGTEIRLHNLVPLPIGTDVEITVRATAVDGRKVSFDVSVRDEVEPICHGEHSRFVVDVATMIKRVQAKAAKRAAAAKPSKKARSDRDRP
jgi:fluoroacetyl-CoA thioesterase